MIPVNRDDELQSRANYYYNWARELIEQESDIFSNDNKDDNSITKEQVHRYFHFLRNGEEKRQYVLQKYQFDDPCEKLFDFEVVDKLEKAMLNACQHETLQSNEDLVARFNTSKTLEFNNSIDLKILELLDDDDV